MKRTPKQLATVKTAHDNWRSSYAEYQQSWQQANINTDAARKSEHQKTHERFNPGGRAIIAAMNKGDE